MPIIAKSTGSADFELCPKGTIQAVVSNVYDIGLHTKINPKNGKEETQHQVIILFELSERMKNEKYAGERFVLSKTYNLNFHELSNLHKDTESILGIKIKETEYDIENLIGENCYLSVIHQVKADRTYVNINGIIALPIGIEKMIPELDRNHCPDWIKKKIDGQIKETISMDEYFERATQDEVQMAAERLNSMIEDGIINSFDITAKLRDYGVQKINELSSEKLKQFMNEIV